MTDVDGVLETLRVFRRGAHDGVEREVGYSTDVPAVEFPDDAPDEVLEDDSWRAQPEQLIEAFGWDDPRRPGVTFERIRPRFGTSPSAWEAFFVEWLKELLDAEVDWPDDADVTAGESVVAEKLRSEQLSPWSDPEAFSTDTHDVDVGLRRADTPRGEARAAARSVRAWLVDETDGEGIGDPEAAAERLDDVLVLLPDDSQLIDLWQREFDALDLPVDAPRTGSLAETGFARWMVDVTALAGWRDEPRPRPLLRRIFEGNFWSAPAFCEAIDTEVSGGKLRWELRDALREYRGDSVAYSTWCKHLKARGKTDQNSDASRVALELTKTLMKSVDTSGDKNDLFRRLNQLFDDSAEPVLGIRGAVHAGESATGEQTDDSSLFGAVRSVFRELSKLEAKLDRGESSSVTDSVQAVYDGELRPERLLQSTFSGWSAPADDTRPAHGVTLLPTRLYDGRSVDKLIVAGLGEGVYPSVPQRWSLRETEWARALGFDERLDPGDEDVDQTRLYTAFANDQLDHQIETVADALDRCAAGANSDITLSYFAEDPERGSELPPGPLMTLLVGGWDAEDWRGGESSVEHVAWADEIPETPADTHGWRELSWFARGIDPDVIKEARTAADDTTQSRLDDLLETRDRLNPSVAADTARTPSPEDGTIELGPRTGDLPGPYDAPDVYSSSALEDYGQCGLKYFFNRGLGIEDPKDADRVLDDLETGTAVHQAMFHTAKEQIDQSDEEPPRWALVFDGDDKESVVANVLATAEKHLENAFEEAIESESSLSDAYESLRIERWKSALGNWANNRIEQVKDWSDQSTPDAINQYVVHVELAFGEPYGEQTEHGDDTDPASVTDPIQIELSDGTTVCLSGKIDRVDYDPDANLLAIRDYKSGKRETAGPMNKSFKRGESVQLPIYALALEQGIEEGHWDLPDGASVGAVSLEYFKSNSGKNSTNFVLSDELAKTAESGESLSYTDVVGLWIQHHVKAIRGGIFPALPKSCPLEDERGAYCDYKKICAVAGNPLDADRVSDPRNTPQFSDSSGPDDEKDVELGFVKEYSEELDNAELRTRHQQARKHVVDLDKSVALAAGAGTGKTHSLVLRYLAALAEGCHPQELLCVTFTRKATADMRQRIRDALLRGLKGKLTDEKMQSAVDDLQQASTDAELREIVVGLSAAPVSTIDSLCADVLRAAEDAQGIGRVSSPDIVSKQSAEEIVERVVDELFFEALDSGDSRVENIVEDVAPGKAREYILEAINSHDPSLDWTTDSVPEIQRTILNNWRRLSEASQDDNPLDGANIESLAATSARLVSLAADWNEKISEALRERGTLRHGDVLAIATEHLSDEVLRRKIAPQFPFRHIFIDELQDTNQAQVKFLRKIHSLAAETSTEDEEPQRFLVGDRKQSIFRFRDAEVDVFEQLLQEASENYEWEVAELTENRRSHPELIRTLNALFRRWLPAGYGADSEEDSGLADPGAEIAYEPLTWPESLSDEQSAFEGAPVELIATPDKGWERDRHRDFDNERRESLVGRIGELVDEVTSSHERGDADDGTPDIAMLVPKWKMADEFQQRMREHGITASIEGGSGLLETREARVLRAWLEAGLYRDRDTPLIAAAQGPGIGLSQTGLYCIRQRFGLDADNHKECGSYSDVSDRLLHCRLDPQSAVDEWETSGEVDRETALSVLREDQQALEDFQRVFREFRKKLGEAPTEHLLHKVCDETGMRTFWHTKTDGRQRLANIESTLDLIRDIEHETGTAPRKVHEELDRQAGEDDPSSGGLVASGGADVVITSYWQAKGREWPVVVLPEIHKTKPKSDGSVGLNRFALRDGPNQKPETVYAPDARVERPNNPFNTTKSDVSDLLKEHRQRGDRAENRRLMYVAMTRAEEQIVMSGNFAGYHSNKRRPPNLAKDHKSWADAIYLAGGLVFEDGEPKFDERGAWGDTEDVEVETYLPSEVGEVSDVASSGGEGVASDLDADTLAEMAPNWRPVEVTRRSVAPMWNIGGSGDVPEPEIRRRGSGVETPSPFEDSDSDTRGEVIHEGLEAWAFDGDSLDEDAWLEILSERGIDVETADNGRGAYTEYLDAVIESALEFDELVDALRSARERGELFTELPVRTSSDDQDTLYRGYIDLVWRDGDGLLHVLDYKTGDAPRSAEAITEDDDFQEYYAQIQAYRRALDRELDVTVADAGLWYVNDGALFRW